MGIKNYSVSLREEIVNRTKNNYKKYGGKLSPLIDELLEKWNNEEEKK